MSDSEPLIEEPSQIRGEEKSMNTIWYDVITWMVNIVLDLFFREVHPRSSWRIPRGGPVIFVAAPHANQFVDPAVLMRIIKKEAGRRVAWLIAAKSMDRAFIGWAARKVGAVPVARAMDSKISMKGKIFLPDPTGDPTFIQGTATDFQAAHFQPGAQLVLPTIRGGAASAEILQILSPTELRIKRPFDSDIALRQLIGKPVQDGDIDVSGPGFEGTAFKLAPKIDQGEVYRFVAERLGSSGVIGIFPEGGSHDRTQLLDLKAGFAIMAFETLSKYPDCGLKIVPCGMNYFNAHKFRSRCVVEFGQPVEVPKELVALYIQKERKTAVSKLLKLVHDAVEAVTVQAPDYETLMLIQSVRRLYRPKGRKVPLTLVVELNRRLMKGYEKYKNDERIIRLKKNVLSYNKQLLQLNIRDHQVENATLPFHKAGLLLIRRVLQLGFLSIAVLPGVLLFSPVFVLGKIISIKKSKEALAASTVKLQGTDVVATWKLLVSLAAAPMFYVTYAFISTLVYTRTSFLEPYLPSGLSKGVFFWLSFALFASISYAALRFGETGMDIAKSLQPLFIALSPFHGRQLQKLRQRREQLVYEVNELIGTLGPELFPDFEHRRVISADGVPISAEDLSAPGTPVVSSPTTPTSPTPRGLPRNESLHDIGSISLFPSRPQTPHHPRSRSRSGSFGFSGAVESGGFLGMTKLDSQTGLAEMHRRIQSGMRERNRRRKSETGFESGTQTPNSELDGLTMTAGKKDT